jgi:hypothetical protein
MFCNLKIIFFVFQSLNILGDLFYFIIIIIIVSFLFEGRTAFRRQLLLSFFNSFSFFFSFVYFICLTSLVAKSMVIQLHYPSMMEGCLFVNVENIENCCTSCLTFNTIGKTLMSKGISSWFYNVLTNNREVIEYWTIFSLKIHLNQI